MDFMKSGGFHTKDHFARDGKAYVSNTWHSLLLSSFYNSYLDVKPV